jgi:PTH1 family peptidyl-tRNA hydrolase
MAEIQSTSSDRTVPAEDNLEPILIVGLGNPGRQYRDTRHNIGFMVVDRLAASLGVAFSRLQFRALTIDTRYHGRRLILAKPQTYMNESGQSAGSLSRFYKIPLENIVVIHDDVDLPFGVLRLRPGGSSAGQKGVESIISRLGSKEFPRLRMGVGRPPGQKMAAAYVLQEFNREEKADLPMVLDRAVEALQVFVTQGLDAAMNRYNGQVLEE